MTANRIIHHIFNQPDIRHVDQAELERLVETYPYFAAARLLLAQKQFVQRPDLTAPALKKAQLYSSNPQHLHQLLTETAPVEEVPVVAAAVKVEEEPVAAIITEELVAEPVVAVETEEPVVEPVAVIETEELVAEPVVAVETEEPVVEPVAVIETEEPVVEPVAAIKTEEPVIESVAAVETEELVTENIVTEAPAPLDIEELEDEISAEDQQILDEIEAEDRANAALAAQQAVKEEIITPEEPVLEDKIEAEPLVDEERSTETTLQTENLTTQEEIAAAEAEREDELTRALEEKVNIQEAIAAKAAAIEESVTTEAIANEITGNQLVVAEEEDEIVALDYEAIKETAAFEAEKVSDAPDEIVALDYDAIKEEKAFKAQIAVDAPDEIVALDYEALTEQAAFEAEKASDAPDEVVAIDYEALKAERPGYEPEIEEEDIVITAEAEPAQTAGISIPPAAEIAGKEEVITDDELEEGPIRIHPIDTPVEETVLTFQPLYTEDYFAYKKLKDPNTAEMMNDKAQAEMRSFTDWLRELKDNFVAGKTTKDWYHQQMHRLYEDDEPEVSERVEKMAMESITLNDDIVSETLAEIWVRQHQHAKAIVIYQKLSLLNPDKNAYFAQKIKELQLLTDNNK